MKEKIKQVLFNVTPQVRLRVIDKDDTDKIKKEKKKFPFKLDNDVIVTIDGGFADGRSETSPGSEKPKPTSTQCGRRRALSEKQIQDSGFADGRRFSFKIKKGYIWNGADIPRCFWRLVGSRTDNAFLTASMVHDFMLENKKFILEDVLKNTMTASEYRRLTSLIFRQILKDTGTGTIKANVMAWCVQIFQCTFNRKEWKNV